MSVSGLGTRHRRRISLLPIISALLLLAAAVWFGLELSAFSQRQALMSGGVSIAGVQVGDLTQAQAVARLEQAFVQPVVLYYANSPILLDPASVGFRVSTTSMLAQARALGDVEIGFWARFFNYLTGRERQQAVDVPLLADYQRNLLEQLLRDIAARYDRAPSNPGFDAQTLTTFSGTTGYKLDIPRALDLVDAALRSPDQRTVVLPIGGADASRPGIDTLRDVIIAYLDSEGFAYNSPTSVASVFIMDLKTGDEINILSDVAFSAASTIKVAILIDYFRTLSFAPTPEEAWLMANSLLCSNNSSSNLIMQIIGNQDLLRGLGDVNSTARYVGAPNTYIAAPFVLTAGQAPVSIPIPATSPDARYDTDADPFNQTTTADLGTMFAMIYDCARYGSGLMAAYPDGDFTPLECQRMLNLMGSNDLLRLLQGGIPAGTPIAHKNGWLNNVHGDAGIVFPPNGHDYVIAVFVWEQGDFFSYERAWPLIEGISRAAWNYFSPDTPLLTARTDLPTTAQECVGNFLPPGPADVNLDDMNAWRQGG